MQIKSALQGRIHQLGTAALFHGSFDHGERQRGYTYSSMHDYVCHVQVSAPHSATVAAAAVSFSRHRDLDDVGREFREFVPPRRRETAGRCVLAVAPYSGSDARRIGERSVIDEVDAAAASNPMTRPQSAPNGFVAEPRASRLCEREDTVLAPQIVIQHLVMDAVALPTVPLRFRRANRRSAWIPAPKSRSSSVVGVNLAYDDRGRGEPVLFIAGRGGAGRTWHLHQVPEFTRAGHRCITFDNRGVGATENADGFTTDTMVADTAALIEKLDVAPVRIVAVSMGAFIAQELMLARPELVRSAVLMATRGRHDRTRDFFRGAELDLVSSGIELPATYDAKVRLLESFSPKTLNDDVAVRDWIDMFTMWPSKPTAGMKTQLTIAPEGNRLAAYRSIATPVLVIGFEDDVVLPAHLAKEVADAIPNGRYLEIPHTGHLGFIERPQVVNAAALKFFADA